MQFNQFIENQETVYESMRKAEKEVFSSQRIEPDPALENRRGGFFLSFVYKNSFAEKIATFSRKIGEITPSMVYSANDIHTTAGSIADSVQDHFYIDHSLEEHIEALESLCSIAAKVAKEVSQADCKIDFSEKPLLLPNVVLLTGNPSEAVVSTMMKLAGYGKECDITIQVPYDAHITVNRFTETGSSIKVSAIAKQIASTPIFGSASPIGLSAGYTLRNESERHVKDLRETPGHFFSSQFFPFIE